MDAVRDPVVVRQHTGSAAAVSGSHAVGWIHRHTNDDDNTIEEEGGASKAVAAAASSSMLYYAQHALVHLTEPVTVRLKQQPQSSCIPTTTSTPVVRHVTRTLRSRPSKDSSVTTTPVAAAAAGTDPVIATTCTIETSPTTTVGLVTGWSDGSLRLWQRRRRRRTAHSHTTTATPTQNDDDEDDDDWMEYSIPSPTTRSVTCLAASLHQQELSLGVATSDGATLLRLPWPNEDNEDAVSSSSTSLRNIESKSPEPLQTTTTITPLHTTSAVSALHMMRDDGWILVGTAAPRHNQIRVYTRDGSFRGALDGHEDWITSLAMSTTTPSTATTLSPSVPSPRLLASASQDARIRLWQFTTVPNPTTVTTQDENDDDDDEQGESRLELTEENGRGITSVSLDAILYGHEESVTAAVWHPNPRRVYGVNHLLVSSSLDRILLLWACQSTNDDENDCDHNHNNSGIWTPIARVGSAGGILGGSMGSTLLGFCSVVCTETTLVGHGYGGTLHLWDLDETTTTVGVAGTNTGSTTTMASMEERASLVQWKAAPCVTGHFAGVTDVCWEAVSGAYLLTVSHDQTCRLWAPVPKNDDTNGRSSSSSSSSSSDENVVWLELARPQVHGYNLSAVESLSTLEHPHFIVSGADEKELRAFDAPQTTLRILDAASCGIVDGDRDTLDRVERAFIPSLGLSNKASAADAAQEDDDVKDNEGSGEGTLQLPMERDLGSVSLWPEVQKLYGHNTEIYCLSSTLAAHTAGDFYNRSTTANDDVLLASSTKAREIDDASIRLWNARDATCRQVLSGGHKSTVATLSFSPNGCFLASSGKDRRLCIWQRDMDTAAFSLAWAKESAHKRIIWCVHFCPYDDSILASGSRDGCVRIWKVIPDREGVQVTEIHVFSPRHRRGDKSDAVTALSFAPLPLDSASRTAGVLALGLESGLVELWKIPFDATSAPELYMDVSSCHVATISKLAWRPIISLSTTKVLHLASGSMDHGWRIFEVPRTS